MENTTTKPKKASILQRLGLNKPNADPVGVSVSEQISPALAMSFGATSSSAAALMGSGKRSARARHQIYDKWAQMESDPIVSTALMLLCTAALGGHETTGQLVFIEPTAKAREDEALAAFVEEIAAQIAPMLNRVAFQLAYTGAAFGDAYVRVYADDSGVVDVYSDEMVRPMLVQPFEKGSKTVGFAVSIGERNFERLDAVQMVRLKMPRTQWVPQPGVIEKSIKIKLAEDDLNAAPLLPGMAGGSLLFNAEEAYDNLAQSLAGLVGQRWLDSMDEQIMTLQMDNMTQEQQRRFSDSVLSMLRRSKDIADEAVRAGRPVLERIRHVIPVFGEKQLATVNAPSGSGRVASLGVEDVIFHARLLAGSIGVDLSMIGFADQLSGGLGDGGFFRVSAQAAERARVIRVALGECFDAILDVHCLKSMGATFAAHERPWAVNFYGGISALEAEKQKTRTDAMSSVSMMGSAFQVFKDLGATPEIMQRIMSKEMGLDEDDAALLSAMFAPGAVLVDGGGLGSAPEPADEGLDDEPV